MNTLEFLYVFDNLETIIIEVKIISNKSLAKDKKFHWLSYNKKEHSFKRLTFKEMKTNSRTFEQGELLFNEESGDFISQGISVSFKRHINNNLLNEAFKIECFNYLKDFM